MTDTPDIRVCAECHTDDMAVALRFDARPWFDLATDKEVMELVECNWGGDYPADEVAEHQVFEVVLSPVFDYITHKQGYRSKDHVGFERHVHPCDALKYLQANRPHLAQVIAMREPLDYPVYLSWLKSDPHWDKDTSWDGDYQQTVPHESTVGAAAGPR